MDLIKLYEDIVHAIRMAEAKRVNTLREDPECTGNVYLDKLNNEGRCWWMTACGNFETHSAVYAMLERGYRAADMHLLVLQHPHRAEKDETRLAYVQSEEKGRKRLYTVTSIGKYLHRHFPQAPDHVIRDVVAIHEITCKMGITFDMEEMLGIITDEDVYSCMCVLSHEEHPYRCYDPKLGWGLAYREDRNGDLLGRALVYKDGDLRCWVRSYKGDADHRDNDLKLENWLEENGWKQKHGWPYGAELRMIRSYDDDDDILAPYLDGSHDCVSMDDEAGRMRINSGGEYTLSGADGTLAYSCRTCENCGIRCQDTTPVGQDGGDGEFCENCQDDFVEVYGVREQYASSYGGSRRRVTVQYWLAKDEAVSSVDGDWYDPDNLPDSMVTLDYGDDEGKVCNIDDTVSDIDGYYWHQNDIVRDVDYDGVIRLTAGSDEGKYVDTDHAFECLHDGEIYHDDDGYVEVDGGKVATDNHEAWLEAQATQEVEVTNV